MKNRQQFILALILVVLASLSRLVPHAMNFTPITALALFSVFAFSGKWKIIIPFSAIILSDVALEIMHGYGFHNGTWIVYMGFALMLAIGYFGIRKMNAKNVIFSTLAASTAFFLITNFALFYPEITSANNLQGYPHTWQGIVASYTAGLPFFRNMLVGDLIFTSVLFGVYALANRTFLKQSLAS